MGVYLNGKKPFDLFLDEAASTYFVDKSNMLRELIPLMEKSENIIGNMDTMEGKSPKYICITRPRRFGKTLMASMIASYFSKGRDSHKFFQKLNISSYKDFENHINHYNVIFISFNELPDSCSSYTAYISRIKRFLKSDLKTAFPNVSFDDSDAIWDILNFIYEAEDDAKFVFVLDEWDYIFHRDFVSAKDKKDFLDFLSNLLKGQPYVKLAYMTGILPVAKYSSGSELNMFLEYSMASQPKFSEYFGFTDKEVDELYSRYLKKNPSPHISREDLRTWYDGYHTLTGERMYNPRSVVAALNNDQIGSYWSSSGPYDEIFYYIEKNIADVKEPLALMIAGESIPANVEEYAATSMDLHTRDEIFSAMVVYGFLSVDNQMVSIPNRELMNKFSRMIQKESSLGYVYRLARESDRMLAATLSKNTAVMEEILSYAHDTETPLLSYNKESELSAIVNLVYLSARDKYDIQREDKAGIGYVDFIFYPKVPENTECIILELKADHSPDEAIQQIKDRKYALRFKGKLGEKPRYTGKILLVGIGYDKETKVHSCKIEEKSEACCIEHPHL